MLSTGALNSMTNSFQPRGPDMTQLHKKLSTNPNDYSRLGQTNILSVSCDLLYYMMGRLGFISKWISLIKVCLESTTIFVLVNVGIKRDELFTFTFILNGKENSNSL